MKFLTVAAIISLAFGFDDTNDPATNKAINIDTTKWWRLIILEDKTVDGAATSSGKMDFTEKETSMMYLQFINNLQVVNYVVFNAYKPDTATFKRSRDTLFINRYKSGNVVGRDTFLVKKQTADSLVLYQTKRKTNTTLRFDNKKLEAKQKQQLSADFFTKATRWKLVTSQTYFKYQTGESTTKTNMLDKTNAQNEIFLFLDNDTTAVRTTYALGTRDTIYYKKTRDLIIPGSSKSGILTITTQTKDSLILTQKEIKPNEITIYSEHYVNASKGN